MNAPLDSQENLIINVVGLLNVDLALAKLEWGSRDDGDVDRVLVGEEDESAPSLPFRRGEVARPESLVVEVHDLW